MAAEYLYVSYNVRLRAGETVCLLTLLNPFVFISQKTIMPTGARYLLVRCCNKPIVLYSVWTWTNLPSSSNVENSVTSR